MTIVAAAFCPHPPLLVPAVGAGEAVGVRAPAVAAVRWMCSQPIASVLVLGSGEPAGVWTAGATGSFRGYGVDAQVQLPGERGGGEGAGQGAGAEEPLPLPLAVGAWLLEECSWAGPTVGVTCDAKGVLPGALDIGAGRTGLLAMGDGSARRTEKAPGWLDERAAGYDAGVSAALASGQAHQLATDLDLGAELLAAGAPAWLAASRLLSGAAWSAGVSYDDAPYGVGYFVASWSIREP